METTELLTEELKEITAKVPIGNLKHNLPVFLVTIGLTVGLALYLAYVIMKSKFVD